MTQFGISIGNLPVLIETSDTGIADFIQQNFQGFIVSHSWLGKTGCDIWSVYTRLPSPPPSPTEPAPEVLIGGRGRQKKNSPFGEDGGQTLKSSSYAVNSSRSGSHIELSRYDFSATLDLTKKRCDVSLQSPDLIDVFLRVFYSTVGIYNHSILLHAAGLKYKGTAHLFVAPPMGGKTTIVKNAFADEVFSDELVLLSKPNGYWKAYSTPFGGSFPASVSFSARISVIWFLQKSNVCAASTVKPVDCARSLLRNVLFFSRNTRDHNNVLELVSDLVASVPAQKLKFMRNTEVTKCINTVKRQLTAK